MIGSFSDVPASLLPFDVDFDQLTFSGSFATALPTSRVVFSTSIELISDFEGLLVDVGCVLVVDGTAVGSRQQIVTVPPARRGRLSHQWVLAVASGTHSYSLSCLPPAATGMTAYGSATIVAYP